MHTATKTEYEKLNDEAERLVRTPPKQKPPRKDLRRERIEVGEEKPEKPSASNDKDLSHNYKKVAEDYENLGFLNSHVKCAAPEHPPGTVWMDGDTIYAKNMNGLTHSGFTSTETANAFAKGKGEPPKTPSTKEQPPPVPEAAKVKPPPIPEAAKRPVPPEQEEKKITSLTDLIEMPAVLRNDKLYVLLNDPETKDLDDPDVRQKLTMLRAAEALSIEEGEESVFPDYSPFVSKLFAARYGTENEVSAEILDPSYRLSVEGIETLRTLVEELEEHELCNFADPNLYGEQIDMIRSDDGNPSQIAYVKKMLAESILNQTQFDALISEAFLPSDDYMTLVKEKTLGKSSKKKVKKAPIRSDSPKDVQDVEARMKATSDSLAAFQKRLVAQFSRSDSAGSVRKADMVKKYATAELDRLMKDGFLKETDVDNKLLAILRKLKETGDIKWMTRPIVVNRIAGFLAYSPTKLERALLKTLHMERKQMSDKLSRQGALRLTADIDRIASVLSENALALGIPQNVALDFAKRADLLSDVIEKTAGVDPVTKSAALPAASEPGREVSGPLDTDFAPIKGDFTQQEFRETGDKAEKMFGPGPVSPEQRPARSGVQAALKTLTDGARRKLSAESLRAIHLAAAVVAADEEGEEEKPCKTASDHYRLFG